MKTRIWYFTVFQGFRVGTGGLPVTENGYQVTDIQRIIGLASPQSVYKWERGDNLPSIDSAVILAWIFDIPVEDLFVLNDSDEDLDEEDKKVTACK